MELLNYPKKTLYTVSVFFLSFFLLLLLHHHLFEATVPFTHCLTLLFRTSRMERIMSTTVYYVVALDAERWTCCLRCEACMAGVRRVLPTSGFLYEEPGKTRWLPAGPMMADKQISVEKILSRLLKSIEKVRNRVRSISWWISRCYIESWSE